ncbi:MAG: hypothetical protein E7360_01215 [Clostridiales bacterium]|nr:hypothetical protein [Clostridiales bacterium]
MSKKIQRKKEMIKFIMKVGIGLFFGGILLTLIGLIAQKTALTVVGVLVLIIGAFLYVYEMPVVHEIKELEKVCDCVKSKGVSTEKDIASQLSVTEKKARDLIDKAFRAEMLLGYVRKGQSVYLYEEYVSQKEQSGKIAIAINCQSCGASFKGFKGEVNQCPYCASCYNA